MIFCSEVLKRRHLKTSVRERTLPHDNGKIATNKIINYENINPDTERIHMVQMKEAKVGWMKLAMEKNSLH